MWRDLQLLVWLGDLNRSELKVNVKAKDFNFTGRDPVEKGKKHLGRIGTMLGVLNSCCEFYYLSYNSFKYVWNEEELITFYRKRKWIMISASWEEDTMRWQDVNCAWVMKLACAHMSACIAETVCMLLRGYLEGLTFSMGISCSAESWLELFVLIRLRNKTCAVLSSFPKGFFRECWLEAEFLMWETSPKVLLTLLFLLAAIVPRQGKIGLDDLQGLLQPSWFSDAVICGMKLCSPADNVSGVQTGTAFQKQRKLQPAFETRYKIRLKLILPFIQNAVCAQSLPKLKRFDLAVLLFIRFS